VNHYISQNRLRSRYLAITAVLALHVALIAAILVSSRFRHILASSNLPLEITFLPKEDKPFVRPPPTHQVPKKIRGIPPTVSPAAHALELAQPSPTPSAPNVDWVREAEAVAATKARENYARGQTGSTVSPPTKSAFASPPAHHAGDEFTTASGERAVYVSENCYQVASSFSYSPNAMNNGMAVQTYCNGASNAPRGDLFDELPAYKKFHADP